MAEASATSGPAPEKSGWVTKGATGPGGTNHLVLNTANFPAGTYDVACWTTNGGEGVWYTQRGVSVPANGSTQMLNCYFGYPGEQVWLEVIGTYTTPRLTW